MELILFPESPTGTLVWPNFTYEDVTNYAEVYPSEGSSVCSSSYAESYQHYTSACMAKDNSLYVVMNIPEKVDCR